MYETNILRWGCWQLCAWSSSSWAVAEFGSNFGHILTSSPLFLLSPPPPPIQIRKPIFQKHSPHKFHPTCYFIAVSTQFSLDCNKRLYFWIWFKFPWRVLSAQPSPFQALITITKTAENSGTRKWKYFHFWIQLSKSFCSSLPCFLCSSAALESLHTEAKASS